LQHLLGKRVKTGRVGEGLTEGLKSSSGPMKGERVLSSPRLGLASFVGKGSYFSLSSKEERGKSTAPPAKKKL